MAISALTAAAWSAIGRVRAHLGALLLDGPGPLLHRRDLIVKHFDRLVKEKGEAAVVVP